MSWYTAAWCWLISTSLGSLVLLTVGSMAVHICRQPVRRLRLIELTLAGCLLAPLLFLMPGLPRWPIAQLALPAEQNESALSQAESNIDRGTPSPSSPVELARVAESRSGSAKASQTPKPSDSEAAAASMTRPIASEPAWVIWPSIPIAVIFLYSSVVAILALRHLAGWVRLVRLRASGVPVPRPVADLFAEIAGPAGAGARLLVTDRIDMPLTFRCGGQVIMLPGDMCRSGDVAALRYSLAHEWSHVERGDIRSWNRAALVQVFFFYQPLFWWLRRQLRLCQDYLADARAAEQAPLAVDYASFLVGLARRRLRMPPLPALGVADRRSNLYRRIMMLIKNQQPLERSCPGRWSWVILGCAVALLAAVAGLRLEAGAQPDPKGTQADKAQPDSKKDGNGETLKYGGKVVEKGTGKPLQGATVVVRRSIYGDPNVRGTRLLQETKHVTDAQGKYTFTIPPEQARVPYLFLDLDVFHPTHAPQTNFGYALSMIRKNEKIGARPFFETIELQPGEQLTGTVQTPDGKPAPGVIVKAFSKADVSDPREYGCFAFGKTDAKGVFQVTIVKDGSAVYWLLPQKYAPSTHLLKKKRGDQGLFVLQPGIRLTGKVLDAKGKPLAAVWVNATRQVQQPVEDPILERVGESVSRSALTDARGRFEMNPLPSGQYDVKPEEYNRDSSRDGRLAERPLAAVFLSHRAILKDGEKPEPLSVQAAPHVIIEAQFLDSKGKPTRGNELFVSAQIDKQYWFGQGKPDARGKIRTLAPHGANVQLNLATNEHGVLRHRKKPDGPLSNTHQLDLGTVTEDVKGIEIIHYVAPIVLVKVVAKDGGEVKDAVVTAAYRQGKGPFLGGLTVKNGLTTDVSFEHQEDGRFRSKQMLPDEEVIITAHAEGYPKSSTKIKLAEGARNELTLVLEAKKEEKKK